MAKNQNLNNINITTQILIGFAIVTASAIISISISHNNSNKIINSADWVVHTHEVLTQLGNIEALLVDLETGQRGFLITGKSEYLEPFIHSKRIIDQELNSIRELTADNSRQTPRIDSLKLTVNKKIEELDLTIHLRKKYGFEAAKEVVDNDIGKLLMDTIRSQISEIEREELLLLAVRSPKPEQIKETTFSLLVGLFAFTTLIIIVVSYFIYRGINRPIRKLKEGLEHVAKGELDYKFNIKSGNEFGILSRFIESILLELKETIVSKNELESEIVLRKQIEKDLNEIKINLENRNKELEQFTYITSHDLQEPINSLISFSDLLNNEKSKVSEVGQKSIEVISDSSYRMRDLIKELLEYSRIGKRTDETEIDVEVLISDVKTDLHSLVDKKQASVTYVGEPLKIKGYKFDLIKLFQNLIVNAIKYTEEQISPVVTINSEEHSDQYKFSVTDNGIGIEENHFDKIFKIFQRLHTRDQYSGTGIGLSHCQKVVELHNGKIWLTSQIGKGSTFYFTISK
ncbi:CHASE3 domain-containing protein [Flammeovirga sp. EKP202]|uniref:sensor histidine kinase n=1 Tax=Flammeovirga sp. EKP202 TaxID=2770592 RepID=UPI00165F300A|nr:CHASE3 domain-containing protein [Flammeovirga sp. EKP202]MBD0405307.1 CHASE3 domain-containing protein [Flammeovirga sp. EKP202]